MVSVIDGRSGVEDIVLESREDVVVRVAVTVSVGGALETDGDEVRNIDAVSGSFIVGVWDRIERLTVELGDIVTVPIEGLTTKVFFEKARELLAEMLETVYVSLSFVKVAD